MSCCKLQRYLYSQLSERDAESVFLSLVAMATPTDCCCEEVIGLPR